MEYNILLAGMEDLETICGIYAKARAFMAENGNPDQWGTTYPETAMISRDIAQGNLYTLQDGNVIHGVFYLCRCEDPTYQQIFQGDWHFHEPYAVIHRIAGDGSGGIVSAAVNYALKQCSYVRIDTHEQNVVMQRSLQKNGFQYCGIIYVEDGSPRYAYDLRR